MSKPSVPRPRKKKSVNGTKVRATDPQLPIDASPAELEPMLGGQADPLMIQAVATIRTNARLAPYEADLVPQLEPAVHLRGTATTMVNIPRGASRIAGIPDLPLAAAWPTHKHQPLEFVAQIHLPHVPIQLADFPTTGTLWFFHRWSDDGEGTCRVLHDEAPPHQLVRTEPPEGLRGDQLGPLALTMTPVMTAAPYGALRLEWKSATGAFCRSGHQLGGHPDRLGWVEPAAPPLSPRRSRKR